MSSQMAYWMFISPTTSSSRAMRRGVLARWSRGASRGMLTGGMTQAESPEWMPASSMCSMTAGTKASVPSAIASASASMAFSRNLSIRIGRSGRDVHGRGHVVAEHLLVVDDLHAAAAQHVGGPHHERVADPLGDRRGPRRACWPCRTRAWGCRARSIIWRNRSRSSARSIVSGEVPRIVHAGLLQLARDVQRRLAAELARSRPRASPSRRSAARPRR